MTKSRPNRRPRTLSGEKRPMQFQIPIDIVSAEWDDTELTIVFNQTVRLSGIPQYAGTGGLMPTAATMTAPNTLVLTYPDAGKGAPSVTIPSEEPAIRNTSGGYVTPSSFPA
jgi:hypothetical protein